MPLESQIAKTRVVERLKVGAVVRNGVTESKPVEKTPDEAE
jgi:hypothetical protein